MRIVITVQENTPYLAYFDGKEGDAPPEILVETSFCDSVVVTEPDYYMMVPQKDRGTVEREFSAARSIGYAVR